MEVKEFDDDKAKDWDSFVLYSSVNGTFLQTRNFLNYHPKDRFIDSSIMIYDGNKLAAVVPACEIINEYGEKEFYSHKGSTYGGIIVGIKYYHAEALLEIVKSLDMYVGKRFKSIVLKITADFHSRMRSDLLQYVLEHEDYSSYSELNSYIDLYDVPLNVRSYFDRNKNRNIKKCEDNDLSFRQISSNDDIASFYKLLGINLSKYNLKPIHTLDEILDFKNSRIPNNVKFYGVFKKEKMMAGGMMFIFDQANTIHAQNLSADYRFNEYSPITYMYYKVIETAKSEGYRYLSWGISTEDKGKVLNLGLIKNKESYGSKYQLNKTFYKKF